MPVSEFELIARYFASHSMQSLVRQDVVLGIGDDCALVIPEQDALLAMTMDTLVEGVHFPKETSAYDIGYKALAVNLSDLAAMGASPQWFTLALTLPSADEEWLKNFSEGLFSLAELTGVQLVGGDVTRGPLTITIQAHGSIERDAALRRDGANVGDGVFVSGSLGGAGVGLLLQDKSQEQLDLDMLNTEAKEYFARRLNQPRPQLALGEALKGIASAAIDISDGLVADLQHLLDASQCGARLEVDAIPISDFIRDPKVQEQVRKMALNSGDDYELCFTAPLSQQYALEQISEDLQCLITRVGMIEQETGLRCILGNEEISVPESGYRHF